MGVGLHVSWGLWPLKAHCYATAIHILKLMNSTFNRSASYSCADCCVHFGESKGEMNGFQPEASLSN